VVSVVLITVSPIVGVAIASLWVVVILGGKNPREVEFKSRIALAVRVAPSPIEPSAALTADAQFVLSVPHPVSDSSG
jgi:hypothetical protein